MRILLLSDTNSEHTEKWAMGLASSGVEVGLFSFNKASYPWYKQQANITLLFEPSHQLSSENLFTKLGYIKLVFKLKKTIIQFKPDVLHAHYATSYGLIGALAGFKPYVISAWGTDVMKFPQQNFINKSILKFNLRKANVICATSNTIKEYLKPVTNKHVQVIPFGVDTSYFIEKDVVSVFSKTDFVIGCIKALETIYNIDVVINAFAILKNKYPNRSLKLLILGTGSQEQTLKQLVRDLNLNQDVIFSGRVPFQDVVDYFNMLDVFVNISDYESFGVSVIEAMACRKPVVATNTGGLKEIIENDNYGSLVPVGNVEQTVFEIERYLLDENLKHKIGEVGRQKVIEKYNWKDNVKLMISIYTNLIQK